MLIGLLGKAGCGKSTVAEYLCRTHGFVSVSLADPLKRFCRDVFDFSEEQLWGPSENRNAPDKRYPTGRTGENAWLCQGCAAATHGHPFEYKTIGRIGPGNCAVCGEVTAAKDFFYVQAPAFLTPRHALQQLGTEWGRNCYPNIWVDYALRVAATLQQGNHLYNPKDGLFRSHLSVQHVVIPDVRFQNEVEAIRAAGGEVWHLRRPGAGLSGAAATHVSETEQSSIPPELFSATLDNNSDLETLSSVVKAVLHLRGK